MGDRLLQVLAGQAQPVRLYSPNPDAPQWAGLPPTPEEPRAPLANRLWNAVKNAPGQLWGMLPPEARNAYTSGAQALVDMSTPASVRDYTTSAQDTARSAMQGDGWGTATSGLGMVNAALGAIPIAGMGVRAAQKVGMGLADEGRNFIRAYHGSPHSFDKFDLSKIGTGEGAQAYGHGLYFAENEGVAKGYRDALTKQNPQLRADHYGQPAQVGTLDYIAQSALLRDGDPANAKFVASNWRLPDGVSQDQVNARIEQLAAQYPKPTGSMYEVAIHADPAKFLDWDKPLSQQSPEVLDAIKNVPYAQISGYQTVSPVGRALEDARSTWMQQQGMDTRGQQFHKQNVSKDLASAGIPGIKYLDAGSRGAGDGSRNFVVFDDSIIEILRKYGLLPFAGAAGAYGLSQNGDAGTQY